MQDFKEIQDEREHKINLKVKMRMMEFWKQKIFTAIQKGLFGSGMENYIVDLVWFILRTRS